jgi:hypothetical protein
MTFSKALIMRLVWFVVGAGISYSVNLGLYRLFHNYVGWHHSVAYAITLCLSAVVLFLWNYFVGFRTKRPIVGSAWRHAVCYGLANILDYSMFVSLIHIFPHLTELVLAAVKAFVVVFKFAAYHYWVYPVQTDEPVRSEGGGPIAPVDEPLPPRAS